MLRPTLGYELNVCFSLKTHTPLTLGFYGTHTRHPRASISTCHLHLHQHVGHTVRAVSGAQCTACLVPSRFLLPTHDLSATFLCRALALAANAGSNACLPGEDMPSKTQPHPS